MAVNLATKYSDKIATAFTHASYVKGNTSSAYDFTGVKTLKIYTPTTVPEVDYTRDGANRYGAPVEMQDTVQEMKMTQDKAFSLTIDKGNNEAGRHGYGHFGQADQVQRGFHHFRHGSGDGRRAGAGG